MIRKFYLENEYGLRWDLNNPATGLLTEPDGLGCEMEYSYSRIGRSFVRNFFREKQQKISGKAVFGGDKPYIAFHEFTEFTNSSDNMKLIYVTDVGEYRRDIDIVEVKKSELKETQILECGIVFICKGLFYSSQTNRFSISRSDGELRWDFRWPARFNDYGSRRVTINNDGHVPAPFELEIYGYAENPSAVILQNGAEVHRVVFPGILDEGEKILYSSVDGNLYCVHVDAAGNETNFADSLDINNTNFFKFPVGETQMQFTSSTGAANRTILTIYKFFRTV